MAYEEREQKQFCVVCCREVAVERTKATAGGKNEDEFTTKKVDHESHQQDILHGMEVGSARITTSEGSEGKRRLA